jgi:hypothetical protein
VVPFDQPAPDAADLFYEGALDRIKRCMLVLGPVAAVVAWGLYGWKVGVGLALGAVIAYANFHWLKQAVSALADRVTQSGERQSGRGIMARFLLRYFLIGLGAYAIFTVSVAALYGLLGGLFLTVGAIVCEAVYEAYVALRRGL